MLTQDCKLKLKAVFEKILENPLTIKMEDWLLDVPAIRAAGLELPECGTVGCIAGWVVKMSLGFNPKAIAGQNRIYEEAVRLLGISRAQADRLFYVVEWPLSLRRELDHYLPQSQEYARVVARRIDTFIYSEVEA